jgi:amidophosphoribosyltransferase
MKSVQENCGLFGIYSTGECVTDIYQGIDFLQHRGQQFCGIATYDHGIHLATHHGKVGDTFTRENLDYLKADMSVSLSGSR